ncbi:related to PRP43 - spliceosomal RNA helicase (DEAH-box family) [Ustilago trichophora]|uniref:RNA helicase n=1 Tax=Ustilago trichophora TaxID=86804 RepID=A0A5C3EAH4_9BASI|nr:related to PRP43 - spliceosomal RNA helicase (DEAH-box family) [Ustilago trichophora]
MSASTSISAKPAFWKPGTSRPGSSLDRSSETEFPLITPSSSTTSTLPIYSQRLQILHALETHQVLIIIAEPGSGKTTAIPRILHAASWSSSGIIACTQPRRISAISVATHVSSLLGSPLGDEVGYAIRFESNTTPSTKVCYMTDGTLFRECMRDPLLTRYSVIMVDEAHERGIYTDLLLGVLKKVLRKRRDLKLVVSSATLDAMVFKDFFDESHTLSSDYASNGTKVGDEVAKVIQIKGRTFPVHIAYLRNPCADYLVETVETIWKIHVTEPQGDILAFLTGREEIHTALQMLSDRQASLPASAARMQLSPLHAGLSTAEQASIFSTEKGGRKVVVATNIAEASITLDGIVYVIDCGFVKQRLSHLGGGVDSLTVVPISRASAIQRAGRAGRTRAGKCFRLYSEAFFLREMQNTTSPELNRIGLEGVVLMLKSLGVDNLVRFEWVPPAPPPENLATGLQRLVELAALDQHARLTPLGQCMAELPLPPHLARILIASAEESINDAKEGGGGCAEEMLSILSMLQVTHPFYAPDSVETQLSLRQFAAQEGDLFTLLNLYLAFVDDNKGKRSAKWSTRNRVNFQALSRALSIRTQLQRYLVRFSSSSNGSTLKLNPRSSVLGREDAVERITRTLAKGLYANLARYDETTMTFRTALDGKQVYAHPNSVFFNRRPDAGKMWVLYGEAVEQSTAEAGRGGQTRTYIRDITVLGDLEWVTDAVPGFYDVRTQYGRGQDGGGAKDVVHTISG